MIVVPYSTSYTPPGPMLELGLTSPVTSLTCDPFLAFLDTGADASIVPTNFIEAISAKAVDEAFVTSPWGERRHVWLYVVDVQLGELTMPGVEIVGDETLTEAILGRDVVNRLRITLDGPRQKLRVEG